MDLRDIEHIKINIIAKDNIFIEIDSTTVKEAIRKLEALEIHGE